MADVKVVVRLDSKLIRDKIIEAKYRKDYEHVHRMLNTHLRQNGQILSEGRFKKGESALRKWLLTLSKLNASQEKLTSYLRCGLAHLCFDFIDSTYKMISNTDLLTRSYSSFKNRKYHTTYFKTSSAKVKKKKAVKRKKTAKKISKRKGAKKVVKKKAAKKKVAKKAVKKAVKKAAKKKVAKKAVKKAVKRPAKKAAKKAAPRKKSFMNRLKHLFD